MTRPFLSFSIRGKMTLAALAPLLLVLLLIAVAIFYLINAWIVDEAQKRVRRQLHSAREVLRQEERHLREVVRLATRSPALAEAAGRGEMNVLREELAGLRQREGLDLLTAAGPRGLPLGGEGAGSSGEAVPESLTVLLAGGNDSCGAVLLTASELRREGEELAARARISLRPPLPPGRQPVETRGMFLVCAAPLAAADGRPLGHLYGGLLLNGNLPLVDRIQEIIYGGETHRGIESGSVTLFFGDLRVATTVQLKEGGRAVGTLVSAEVAEAVLQKRQRWVDRALVVDEWYLTAYEPILDPAGAAIGALYVGLPERPYALLKGRATLLLLGLLLLGGGLGYLVARTISRRLSRPLRELESTARRLAAGERDVQLAVATRDEVGQLTVTFNRMTLALRERECELHSLNRDLERKVVERTTALEEKSLQLIRAQEDLARAERLAAIGSLAAGVAHEINNPAAIIRGNVEILLGALPAEHPEREEAEEILQQTERLSRITGNLLAFAREQVEHLEPVAVNPLLEEVLAGISHQVPLGRVEIRRALDPGLPFLEADGERLRQVFNNLILNALQVMEGEGILTVSSSNREGMVEVAVSDTGPGIPPEIREKIFHPFFTTRRSGTGLGLSVSYGIVRALNGLIEVESEPGRGSTFRVRLPLAPEEGKETSPPLLC